MPASTPARGFDFSETDTNYITMLKQRKHNHYRRDRRMTAKYAEARTRLWALLRKHGHAEDMQALALLCHASHDAEILSRPPPPEAITRAYATVAGCLDMLHRGIVQTRDICGDGIWCTALLVVERELRRHYNCGSDPSAAPALDDTQPTTKLGRDKTSVILVSESRPVEQLETD